MPIGQGIHSRSRREKPARRAGGIGRRIQANPRTGHETRQCETNRCIAEMQVTRVDDPRRPCTRTVAAATHPGDSAGQPQSITPKAVEVGAGGLAYTRMCALRLGAQNPAPTEPCCILVCGLLLYLVNATSTGPFLRETRGGGRGAAHRRQGWCRAQLLQGSGALEIPTVTVDSR